MILKNPSLKSICNLDNWHLSPSSNKDYDFIDGLRGLAILLVVACHIVYVDPASGQTINFIRGIFAAGNSGVILFFALSGFLISLPFWKAKIKASQKIIPRGYGWRRFYKIYPPLAFSILILTPPYIYYSGNWSYIRMGLEWFSGLPLILPIYNKFNPVMWSLAVEVHFYIVLPLIMLCLKHISPKQCLYFLPLFFFAVGFGCRSTNYWFNGSHVFFAFGGDLDVFSLGVLAAGLHSMGMITKAYVRLAHAGFILLILMLPVVSWLSLNSRMGPYQLEATGAGVKIASGLLLCYVADPQCSAARMLCHPLLRWCGIISYEWYLLHQPIFFGVRRSLGGAKGFLPKYLCIIGGSFLFSLILAALIYKLFSLPILRYGRSKNTA